MDELAGSSAQAAGSGGKHAGDCQASPGAAVGELGFEEGRQQLLSQPWLSQVYAHCTCTYISLNVFFLPLLNFSNFFVQLVLSRHNFACKNWCKT